MKLRQSCLVIFGVILLTAAAHADISLFDQANAKYRAGDFKGASLIYQNIIQTGHATAAVYYNLGNTALKSGEKGQALVYYERALLAAPRDKDLRWNLQLLKEAIPDKIEDKSYFALSMAKDALGYVGTDELAILFSVLLGLIAFFSLVHFFSPAVARWTGWIPGLCWIGLLLCAAFFAFKVWEVKDPQAVVLDKEVYAFYGPSESETKAFLLHEGAQGKVTDQSGNWFYMTLGNKKSGWVRKNSCEII